MNKILKTINLFVPPIVKLPFKKILGTEYGFAKILSPNWYKSTIGGRWEEIGQLQFKFMLNQGLKPEDYLLDAGCGSLRAGIYFINYLQPGHYFGIDRSHDILKAARNIVLKRYKLEHKNPVLMQTDSFNFPALNQTFDYAIAQSVFTHLPLNNICQCVVNMDKVLKPNGKFYATFFENPKGKFNLEPIVRPHADNSNFTTYFDKDVYHYDFETLKWLAEGTGLKADYIGEWQHPRHQNMMVFTKDK